MRILFSKYFLFVIAFFSCCLIGLFFLRGSDEITSNLHAQVQPIFAPSEGRVSHWYVKKGDRVRKGDLLFEMDNTSLLRKKIELEKQLDLLEQKEKVEKITLDTKSMEYIQTKQEWSQGQKTKEDVDFAVKRLEHAQALLDLVRAEMSLTKTNYALLDEEIASRRVEAPCNGVIKELELFPQKNVPACLMYDLSTLSFSIDTKLSEKEIKEKFDVVVSSFPNKKFSYNISQKEALSHQAFRYELTLSEEDSVLLFPEMEIKFRNKKK